MMLSSDLEERLRRARLALDGATAENIVEMCRQYLTVLAECRAELFNLPVRLGIEQWSGSCLWEDASNARKAIRSAIEQTTRERHGTEELLLSFTSVSACEAVDTFNRCGYNGHTDWELRGGGVARFRGGVADERMTVLEAVETASLLRREEHVAQVASAQSGRTTCHDLSTPNHP